MAESIMIEQEHNKLRALEREALGLDDLDAGARPDYSIEAVIPDMNDPAKRDLSVFRDEDWKAPPELVLDVF